MLLSIVIMMKNEEKYLDKTLNALTKMMKDINSELIILDTGSTDSSVDIAKRYTDKIYFDKWNDNFGEMRNKSIRYAKGDWVLILDADEELTDYEKLKEFFATDLCKRYNSATISLMNILSNDRTSYSYAPMLRLFKNVKGFGYTGAIHEQPIFEHPIYNNVAEFKHYGYLFEDEEIKQLKESRNKAILLTELEKNPQNPYINYQLGKNYIVSRNYEDALYYMEKGYSLYEKINYIPIFVTLDLANLYIDLGEFNKCEKLCTKYLKKDNNNIDVFYYLATSQKQLNKYKQSIENYKRYFYLLDNYEISTQANNCECNGETLIHKAKSKVNVLDNYYKLEDYKSIVKEIDNIDIDVLEESYLILFMSLYKVDKLEKIVDLYDKVSDSIVQQNKFKMAVETILTRVKEKDRVKMYDLLSNIDGNYGLLNKIRLGEITDIKIFNDILIDEKELYYGDILKSALKQKIDLYEVLKNTDYIKLQSYIGYLIKNRRECIFDIYNYLINSKITLDKEKLQIHSCIAENLLSSGNLVGEKYKTLFYMYTKYSYENIKQIFNKDINDNELIQFLRNEEDKFVVELNLIKKLKNKDIVEYIKKLKKLLISYPQHKKGIEILINDFEKELNQNDELKKLKLQYKSIIEESIKSTKLEEAKIMINEYESIFMEESEVLNMKFIIALMSNNLEDAQTYIKRAWILDNQNFNTVFNIGYLKEMYGENKDALRFYSIIVDRCENEELIIESKEKINQINI